MNPNDKYQPDRPGVPPASVSPPHNQEVPFFLKPEYQQAGVQAKQPKGWNKTLLFAGAGAALLLVLLLIAVLVAARTQKSATTTSTTPKVALTTTSIDGIQFAYPQAWKEADAQTTGFTAGYVASTDPNQNGAAIYYKKTLVIPTATKVSDASSELKQSVRDAIVAGTKQKNTTAAGCKGFSLLTQKPLDSSKFFGMEVQFSCSANAKGVAVQELDRYLYTGDGYLYQVSIIALESAWQENAEKLFVPMSQQIVPRADT